MLVALQKCDQDIINDLKYIFRRLDTNNNGFLEKEDLIKITNESTNLIIKENETLFNKTKNTINRNDNIVNNTSKRNFGFFT